MADRICDIISTACAACSAISANPIGAGALMLSFDIQFSIRMSGAQFTFFDLLARKT
jgi:hypothetical protein